MIQYSKDHKAIVLTDEQVDISQFKKYQAVQPGIFIVADDLDTCKKLNIEGPITRRYKWPGRYVPFKHQIKTSDFLTLNDRCYVFNDIGTGKTMSALWAADFLMKEGVQKRVLIVAPLSTLWVVWYNNIRENFPSRTVTILHGSKARRLEKLSEPNDFYIINHDGIGVVRESLWKRRDISHVIVDEGSILRNARTTAWRNMWATAGPDTRRGIWWMTGSPMPNGPEDVWAQARIVMPNLVDKYFTRFRESVMYKQGPWTWVPKQGWEKRCYAAMQPSVRFVRDECIDLPGIITEYRHTPMSLKQAEVYNKMRSEFIVDLKEGKIKAVNEAVKLGKLLQISSGALYDDNKGIIYLDIDNKLSLLWDIFLESGRKLIVFAPFKHNLILLSQFAEKKKIKYVSISGDVAATTRSGYFNEFQKGSLEMIIAHPETMSHGLDLTASHTIAWWSPHHSNDITSQANGRITRPGQRYKQTIIYLLCSDVEKGICKRLAKKEVMQGLLLELLK